MKCNSVFLGFISNIDENRTFDPVLALLGGHFGGIWPPPFVLYIQHKCKVVGGNEIKHGLLKTHGLVLCILEGSVSVMQNSGMFVLG